MSSSYLPTQQPTPLGTLRELLVTCKDQIAMALPRHVTAERMQRMALTVFSRNTELQKCCAISVVGCVIQAAELGLELSGPLGQAYLVPYWNAKKKVMEAQFQIGYRGLMDLAYRSGRVQTFCARIIYAKDKYKFAYGTKPKIDHMPTLGERGEPVAVYAVLQMSGGAFDFELMSVTEINDHRDRYSKSANGEFSPWKTAWEEMAKKTVIRRLAKRAPLSVELTKAAVLDEYGEAGVPQQLGDEFVLEGTGLPSNGNLPTTRQTVRRGRQPAAVAAAPPPTPEPMPNPPPDTPDPEPELPPTEATAPPGAEAPDTVQTTGLDQDELAAADFVSDCNDWIAQARTLPEIEEAGRQLLAWRARIGEQTYQTLKFRFESKRREITGREQRR